VIALAKAKKPIVEKITTTTKLDLTGTLNLDDLKGFLMEFEEKGEMDVCEKLRQYNGRYGVLSFTIRDEQTIEDEN
jgi:hypothetical protein